MATYRDRISEVPEPLLHDIMSKMPIKYAIRMSILSKRWNSIWQTFPFLDFGNKFYLGHNNRWSAKSFRKNAHLMRKALQIILSRFQGESSNLLKLFWVIPKNPSGQNFKLEFGLEILMRVLSNTQLKKLCLVNYNSEDAKDFLRLPSPLILPRLISFLYLGGFVGLKSLLPASEGTVKFQYLNSISLREVNMQDEVVNQLNETCPFLEILTLDTCSGLTILHLAGLPKLKILALKHLTTLQKVKIEFLPHLVRLIMEEKLGYPYGAVELDRRLSDSLIFLQLVGEFLTDDLFNRLFCKCRFLRSLVLGNSKRLKKVSISMPRLGDLRIICVDKLAKVMIKAPVLQFFRIKTTLHNKPPTISWKHSKPVPRVSVIVDSYEHNWNSFTPSDDKLENWRQFLGCFNNAGNLQLIAPSISLNWLKRERSLSPLCCVKDLSFLSSYHDRPLVQQLLQSLIFLAPRATTLSIINITTPDHKTGTIFAKIVIKFLDDDHSKDAGGTLSSSNKSQFLGIQSWLQSVSEVKIQEFNGEEYELEELNNFFSQVKNFTPFE